MTSSRRTLVRALGAGFVLVALASTLLYANHSWGSYHWARTSNPINLKLGDNVNSAWDSHLRAASSDWNVSTVLDTTVVAGGSRKNCRPTSGRDEICNGLYGNNGWLGLAQIWISGTHITQGAVKLNDTYFNTSTYNTPAWRQMVMCQEIGHTFGLDHQDENFNNPNLGTCMDYTSDPSTNQQPNQGDYDELLCIYDPAYVGRTLSTSTHSCTGTGHLDSTTTVGQTVSKHPSAMNEIDFEGPGQWGKLVKSSHGGGTQIFELDFGGGNKLVTFVTWTLEERDRRNKARQ